MDAPEEANPRHVFKNMVCRTPELVLVVLTPRAVVQGRILVKAAVHILSIIGAAKLSSSPVSDVGTGMAFVALAAGAFTMVMSVATTTTLSMRVVRWVASTGFFFLCCAALCIAWMTSRSVAVVVSGGSVLGALVATAMMFAV